jgi:hypothetical protein
LTVQGSGFRDKGSGFRVQDVGVPGEALRFRVQDLVLRGLWLMV